MSSNCSTTFAITPSFQIPAIGLGTWQASNEDTYNAVIAAIKAGYRHIDTAMAYENEEAVGKAIKDCGVPRSELFITTKLWNTDHSRALELLDISLLKLGLEYLDLYLIHWPIPFNPNGNDKKVPKIEVDGVMKCDIVDDPEDLVKTWKQLETITKTTNKLKSIGVSNVPLEMLKDLISKLDIKPAANQVENHPYLPQHELVKFCQDNDIIIEAYSPLGSTGAPLLKDATIAKIAQLHAVAPSVVVLSWQVQRGVVVLPKSVNENRIVDNLKTIVLTAEDMDEINDLYKTHGKRICNPINFFDTDLFGDN